MAPSSLGKQKPNYESPHYWLMSLAMDIPYSRKVWWGKSLANWASRSFGKKKFGECRWFTGRRAGLAGFNWRKTCNFTRFANFAKLFPNQTFPLYGNFFVWHVEVKIVATNGSHLAAFSEDIAFAHHSMVPHSPLTINSHPIGVLVVLVTPLKKQSKIAGNSASYSVYGRHSELPWIAIDLCRNMCRQL